MMVRRHLTLIMPNLHDEIRQPEHRRSLMRSLTLRHPGTILARTNLSNLPPWPRTRTFTLGIDHREAQ